MTPIEFHTLVRRMRAAQQAYYRFDGKKDYKMKQHMLIESKKLESQVDNASMDETGWPVEAQSTNSEAHG